MRGKGEIRTILLRQIEAVFMSPVPVLDTQLCGIPGSIKRTVAGSTETGILVQSNTKHRRRAANVLHHAGCRANWGVLGWRMLVWDLEDSTSRTGKNFDHSDEYYSSTGAPRCCQESHSSAACELVSLQFTLAYENN